MRTKLLLAVLLASLACISTALAQAATAALNVSWTAPTTAGGFPIAGSQNTITGYNVYASTTPLTATPVTPLVSASATATTVTGSMTAPVGSTIYVYVTACDATGCSALSAAASKVVTAPAMVPDIPTSVTITVTVTP